MISSNSVVIYDAAGNPAVSELGAAFPSAAVQIAGNDGTNLQAILTDTSGRPVIVGAGTAGTPAGGVVSVQGVVGGTSIPVTFVQADNTATGNLNALNAAVAVTITGEASVGFQLAAGTLIGTIIPEISYDGGTTWVSTYFINPSTGTPTQTLVFASSNGAASEQIVIPGGAGSARVRVSAFTSGTAAATVRATSARSNYDLGSAASGAAVPPTIRVVGGNNAGSLLAIAVDASGRQIMVGGAASGSAAAGNPVLSAGIDGTGNVRTMLTDATGRQVIINEKAGTSALTSVPAAVASTQLLASNSARLGAVVINDTSTNKNVLYLALAGSASTSAYSYAIPPGGQWELNFDYTGAIFGIWVTAAGNARVTELSP